VSGTWRVFLSELGRIVRSWWAWGGLAALGALSAVRAYATVAERAVDADGEVLVTSGAAWAPFVDGWRIGLVLGALFLLVHAARGLAGDRETGVLRQAVTRSVARPALVLGRLLLAPVLIVAVAAATAACAAAVAGAHGDFGAFVEEGDELFNAAELTEELLVAARAVLLALVPLYAFGLLVSTLARGSTSAVAAALGALFAFDLFKETLGDAQAFVFAFYVPSLVDTSALHEMQLFARGLSDALYAPQLVRLSWLLPLPATLVCAALAASILSRRTL
jgi:ABC-type transport system involved in multi-copper enzyme maturation permease subunit